MTLLTFFTNQTIPCKLWTAMFTVFYRLTKKVNQHKFMFVKIIVYCIYSYLEHAAIKKLMW